MFLYVRKDPVQKKVSLLGPVTVDTMRKLQVALDKRAFVRYTGKRDNNTIMYDVLLYFHPACRSLWHISNIVRAVGGDEGVSCLVMPASQVSDPLHVT